MIEVFYREKYRIYDVYFTETLSTTREEHLEYVEELSSIIEKNLTGIRVIGEYFDVKEDKWFLRIRLNGISGGNWALENIRDEINIFFREKEEVKKHA